MKPLKVIGLMSGTSLDGIDAALLETDGEGHIRRSGFVTIPYDDALRARIRGCFGLTVNDAVRAVEKDLTLAHAAAVAALLKKQGLQAKGIDLIGFHGQTIAHAPEKGFTCQIGDGALLAKLAGIRVVNDFRTADVKAGGQGAPLVPVYHQALALGRKQPIAFLNIGGVANVTFVGKEVIAFDTGPGNALLDDWMLKKTGQKFDADGKTAAMGLVNEAVLKQLMSHPFFAKKPPKSLDRDAFVSGAWKNLSLEDGAATLAAFTVAGIVHALNFLPENPKEWLVAGGGRLNKSFMTRLQDQLQAPILPIEEIGLDGDAIEAEAFAYLAVRSLRGLYISFPGTTGVPHPLTGGRLNHVPDAA